MQVADVMNELRAFTRKTFKVGDTDKEFTDDVHLFDYGYVDSFGAVHIINFVSQRFGVTISDQDLVVHPLNTIREIATLVHGRLGKTSS